MTGASPKPDASCPSGCSYCRLGDACPTEAGSLSGWRLTLSAVAVFLLPLALAAAGAVVCGPSAGRQLGGALAGLVVGAVAGVAIGRLIRRSVKEAA